MQTDALVSTEPIRRSKRYFIGGGNACQISCLFEFQVGVPSSFLATLSAEREIRGAPPAFSSSKICALVKASNKALNLSGDKKSPLLIEPFVSGSVPRGESLSA